MEFMKKYVLIIFMLLFPLLMSAEKVQIDGIWYNLVSKVQQAQVTSSGDGTKYSGVIAIPSTVTYNNVEYSVTSIEENAFYWCSDLTSIIIPEGITSIGSNAFYACSSLTEVHISNITAWCKITFGDFYSNPIEEAHNLYLNGELVTELMVPKGVTSIKKSAFSSCDCLTTISFSEGMTSIGGAAFSDCSSLTSVVFPKGEISIEGGAFSGCRSLTSVTFLGGGTIGANAFSDCSSLTSIILPEGITSISDRIFYGCNSLMSIILPEGVTKIGNYTFYGCSNLISISIPESVTSIGWFAFFGCSSLTNIVLPRNISHIDSKAFANCPELLDVYCYAESVPNTKIDAFDGSYPEYATLHMPNNALTNYKNTAPWSSFDKFKTTNIPVESVTLSESSVTLIEGESLTLTTTVSPDGAADKSIAWGSSNPSVVTIDNEGKITAIAPGTAIITVTANDGSGVSALCEVTVNELILGKCATPTISYADGKVSLTCGTEEAKVITTVTDGNDNTFESLEFDYIPTYTITAYATKSKYEDSDEVSLTLCWVPCTEEHKSDDTNGVISIPSKPMLIQCTDGIITLTGLAEGTEVKVYDLAGNEIGNAIAANGTATISTGLEAGVTAIVKIGEHSVKVAIK